MKVRWAFRVDLQLLTRCIADFARSTYTLARRRLANAQAFDYAIRYAGVYDLQSTYREEVRLHEVAYTYL